MIVFNLVILCLGVMLFYNFPKAVRQDDIQPMSKAGTSAIRGAAIIGIVIHHFSQYYSDLGPLQGIIAQCGYWLTAVFFFMSGFGCFYSLEKLGKEIFGGGGQDLMPPLHGF